MSDNWADDEEKAPESMTPQETAKYITDYGTPDQTADLRNMLDKEIKRRTPLITGLFDEEEARETHLMAELRKRDQEWAERTSGAKENRRESIVNVGAAFGADRDYIAGRLVEWCGLDQAEAEEYLQNALKERAAANRE